MSDNCIISNMEISTLLDFYGDILTDKQKDVMQLHYNDDLSFGEIALNKKITRQAVYDSIKRSENQLFDLEEKLHLVKSFKKNQIKINKIMEELLKLENINDNLDFSKIVNNIKKLLNN